MALAIFDLDNTLIAGDSDYLWGAFLAERGILAGDEHERENERFYREYREGTLDIYEFLRFSLLPLRDNRPEDLERWRREFLHEKIEPIVLPAALELVERHRAAGDTLLIVTATNAFVTAPIAERLGIPNLIATVPEQSNGRVIRQQEGCLDDLAYGLREQVQPTRGLPGVGVEGLFDHLQPVGELPSGVSLDAIEGGLRGSRVGALEALGLIQETRSNAVHIR